MNSIQKYFCQFTDLNFYDKDFVYAILLISSLLPFWFWSDSIHNVLIFVYSIFYFITSKKYKNEWITELLLLIILFYVSLQETKIGMFASYVSMLTIPLLDNQKILKIYEKVVEVLSLLILLSIISNMLVHLFNIHLPYEIINSLNPGKGFNYRAYWFMVEPNLDVNFFRFYSLFDEAGANGSIMAILLYADGYNLRKKRNIIFFVNGILSLSFFFIVVTLIYYLIILPVVCRKLKKLWYVVLLIPLLYFLYDNTKDDDFIQFFVYNRMEITDNGLSGDNRTDKAFEVEYSSFLNSSSLLFGKGSGASIKKSTDSSTYKSLVYDYGLIWFVLFCLFWMSHSFFASRMLKVRLIYLAFLAMFVYQRPGVINTSFLFLFIAMPLCMKNDVKYIQDKVNV